MNKEIVIPQDFDFDYLRKAACDILALNSMITMSSLIRVANIERDDSINTACIGYIGRKLTIRYNGYFVYENASKPIAFAGLLAHEIFHQILNHLDNSKYNGNRKAWNIAMDCIIQSILYKMNKAPGYSNYVRSNFSYVRSLNVDPGFHITYLMEKIYKLEGIEALLRPPNPLDRIASREQIEDQDIRAMRYKLYRKYGNPIVTEVDIYNFLLKKYKEDELEKIFLLSDNTTDQDNKEEVETEDGFVPGIGNVLSEDQIINICKESSSNTSGYNSKLEEKIKNIKVQKNKDLHNALDKALLNSTKAKIIGAVGTRNNNSKSVVIPSRISKVDLIKLSSNNYPIFFKKAQPVLKKGEGIIYIDVSGSTDDYIDWMYGCILDLSKIIHIECFLFSNKIVKVSIEDIKLGKVVSTGGTDFNCIAEHILRPENNSINKAVIFTDGYAYISNENIKAIKDKDITFIGAVFHLDNNKVWNTSTLDQFCKVVFKIPNINK